MGLQDEMQALKSTSVEELQEQAIETNYLTPRELAKLMGVHAQQVYGWIRKGIIESEKCNCGRTVVNVGRAQLKINKKARELGKPEPYPDVVMRREFKVKVGELLEGIKNYDPNMEVVVELVGNEFEDGDLLPIDGDVGVTVKMGNVTISALSNELPD